MTSLYRRPRSVPVKAPPKVVYAPKASCIVLCPDARMNLAQFCMLLMTIDKQVNRKQKGSYDKPEQKYNPKIKGSLLSGPFIYKSLYSIFSLSLFLKKFILILSYKNSYYPTSFMETS